MDLPIIGSVDWMYVVVFLVLLIAVLAFVVMDLMPYQRLRRAVGFAGSFSPMVVEMYERFGYKPLAVIAQLSGKEASCIFRYGLNDWWFDTLDDLFDRNRIVSNLETAKSRLRKPYIEIVHHPEREGYQSETSDWVDNTGCPHLCVVSSEWVPASPAHDEEVTHDPDKATREQIDAAIAAISAADLRQARLQLN